MRFAYIDSQGKEVSIPSADALRLRIELGAIVDATMFHDASADKWAPAVDHEIYRTLKREVDGVEAAGFVAPPPPTFGLPEEPAPVADEEPEASMADLAPDVADDEPIMDMSALEPEAPTAGPPVDEPIMDLSALEPEPPVSAEAPVDEPIMDMSALEPEAAAPTAEPPAEDLHDFSGFGDLTLEEAPKAEEPAAAGDPMDFDLGGLSVADDDDDDDDDDEDEAAGEKADSGFDMGGFGALTLDEDETAEEEAPGRWDVAADMAGAIPGADFGQDEVAGADNLEAEYPGVDDTFSSGLDGGEAPSWLSDDTPQAADPMESSGGYSGDSSAADGPVDEDGLPARPARPAAEDEAPARPRRTPPPQRKLTPAKSGGAGKLIGFVLLLAVVGAGGWFGFQALAGGGSNPDDSTVALPDLPANLEPQLRQLAARANLYMVTQMQALPERAAIPASPPNEWLLGIYLGNASRYPAVATYWESYRNLLREVRARDDQFFEEGFRAELQAANAPASNGELLDNRAMAGFEAALPDRQMVYDQLEAVITGALALHQFLVDNEADISYEPAAGGLSRDPVLEAVPVTESLGDEMINQMAGISTALDRLGFLDRVTTDQLLAVFFEKLQATAIR